MNLRFLLPLLLLPAAVSAESMAENADVRAFVLDMASLHDMNIGRLQALFANMEPNARVLKLIAPPKTPAQRSWRRYRSRFLEEIRIQHGVAFWRDHAATLREASGRYGVPEEIIVAIIGVETLYGRDTGRFNTLEALSTLAFYYPPRAEFFRQELEQFLLLAQENRMPPEDYVGSYAGAMGISQFMPGSQRRYAVDFDNDGKIDLARSVPDAIGSVAHFLAQHGWQPGMPIAVPAQLAGPLQGVPEAGWLEAGIFPSLPVETLLQKGVQADALSGRKVTLIDLVTPDAPTEYWLGYDNFYVLTRYNRSSFYAMAVFQLAREIRAARAKNGQ
jgi:membrane-bound lytic murein transglycosylase B